MTNWARTERNQNPNAIRFRSLEYHQGTIRSHTFVDHGTDTTPPLHIPVGLEGVAP